MRELERNPTEIIAPEALPPISLVGRGRLGGSLAAAAIGARVEARLTSLEQLEGDGDEVSVALLCVPDDAITATASRVRLACPRLELIGHTSGANRLEALGAATGSLARFSLHPLQTIPDADADLGGVPAAIAADSDPARAYAERLALTLGLRPFEVSEEHRAAYHAAASIASNFLVALEQSAAELLAAAGIPDGRELLSCLVERSLANWSLRGTDALTGPIARGDEGTVAAHRTAIEDLAPELGPMYEAMAERTRALAEARAHARTRASDGAATHAEAKVPA